MQKLNTYILAIESSCDDTSCAVLCNNRVLANITAGQKIHEQYGGVIPELASRDHQKNIVPVVEAALKKAGITLKDLNAIAVTSGPGLMGSLLVGLSFAKSLALALNIPLIGVNHMQGHILAHFLVDEETPQNQFPEFPFICLTVSGGHTQLVKMSDHLSAEILGQTMDDAVGEAFDKAAKVLGLPYPGGPLIDKLAQSGDGTKFKFSSSHVSGYDYSFSGIKTSFLYFIRDQSKLNENFVAENLNDICASYQQHLIKVLLKTARQLLKDSGIKQLAIAGGVSANSELRTQVKALELDGIKTFIPKFEYCTDNAAMIGITGYYKFLNGQFSEMSLVPNARMSL
ncbi:MAG: tRNA (adenosine(37)-N6)-threonylcarbamoyltransferase complex transferase subunit TsaD [Bacteroidia bacterium]|nr:tRNA (adenosine(37)-N6)-threonylcarbamoyltransferase complex transferase subunit TsaD [Bacteroidia bacterium]